jgi:hypothetical protein
MINKIREEKIRKAKLVLADDFLAWHKGIEVKLVQVGIDQKDIDTFVNAAIDEKISREAIVK